MRLQATNHYRSANLRLWQAILGELVDQGIEMDWSVSKKRKNDTVQARAGHEQVKMTHYCEKQENTTRRIFRIILL